MRSAVIAAALLAAVGISSAAIADERAYSIEGYAWGDVYFDTLSAALTDEAKTKLDGLAGWVKENPGSAVLLAGYDDQRTPPERGVELGWERARAVADYLVAAGVSAAGVKAISFGNTRVILPGEGEDVWSKNRRVRYRVMPPQDTERVEGKPTGVCQRCKK